MNILNDRQYSKTHEWVKSTEGTSARIGLSDHAQSELGDLVFVNLPEVGNTVTAGEPFADVESVKAVSDLYSPVSGIVSAVNEQLLDEPGLINSDCYEAWIAEVSDIELAGDLMSAEEYEAFLQKEG